MILYEAHKDENRLRCLLCPHMCLLSHGERGICGVRENTGSSIDLITYGIISSLALDPIEKKPLYHFYPGSEILSAGSYGCNLKCDFCQNHQISQQVRKEDCYNLSPSELVARAVKIPGNTGIAYTYNEPVIWFEYVLDCARKAAAEGLRNVMVTNGYINKGPLAELAEVTDAFNIDLKALDDDFYRGITGASLKPVLNTIEYLVSRGKHVELTTLIIPGLNDSEAHMRKEAGWIASGPGRDIPLHISRYFPMYKRTDPATPEETIIKLWETASEFLDYVYTGNLSRAGTGSDTFCPSCHNMLIRRSFYRTSVNGLDNNGKCLNCGKQAIRYIA